MTARIQPGDGDPRHGTANGYVNRGCRCDACRAAATTYQREWTHKAGRHVPAADFHRQRRVEALARDNHGTETRYQRGCRCDGCRAAAARCRRERRHRAAA